MTKEQLKVGDRVTYTSVRGRVWNGTITLIDPLWLTCIWDGFGEGCVSWDVFEDQEGKLIAPEPQILFGPAQSVKEYPHVCRCGKRAYIGFSMIDHADGGGCG